MPGLREGRRSGDAFSNYGMIIDERERESVKEIVHTSYRPQKIRDRNLPDRYGWRNLKNLPLAPHPISQSVLKVG